jgi:hypothetical protein
MQSRLEQEIYNTINRLRRLGIHLTYEVNQDYAHIIIDKEELIDAVVKLSLKQISYQNKDAYYVKSDKEHILIRVSKNKLEDINLEGFIKVS